MTFSEFISLLPWFFPMAAALVVLVHGSRRSAGPAPVPTGVSALGLLLGFVTATRAFAGASGEILVGGAMVIDRFGLFITALASLSGLGTVLLAPSWLKLRAKNHAEFYVLVLFAVVGMGLMGSTTNLLTLLLALEILSLSLYVLAGFRREDRRSVESALKYYLTGSFATGILLFGMALTYGVTRGLDLQGLSLALQDAESRPFAMMAVGFLLAGFGFKVAAAPFHMWLPDVYEGAPTPVTGFMATGVKVAAFAAIIRLFGAVFVHEPEGLRDVLWWIAFATMAAGNVAALAQKNVKRMLAYSSIAHAGYLLVAIVVMRGRADDSGLVSFASSDAVRGILFYLMAYLVANVGAFGVLSRIERGDGSGLAFADLAGMKSAHPGLAAAMAIFMLSLAGIPGTAGFVGKFLIFGSAVDAGHSVGDESFTLLAILGILNSLVGLYYYLRVLIQMYVQPASEGQEMRLSTPVGMAGGLVIVACAAATLWWGFGPDWLDIGFGIEPALAMVEGAVSSLK